MVRRFVITREPAARNVDANVRMSRADSQHPITSQLTAAFVGGGPLRLFLPPFIGVFILAITDYVLLPPAKKGVNAVRWEWR